MLHKGSGSYAHFCPRPWLSTCRWARLATHRRNGPHSVCSPRSDAHFGSVPTVCVSSPGDWAVSTSSHMQQDMDISQAQEKVNTTQICPPVLPPKKKNAQKTTHQKGGPERPRAPQSEPKRPRAPQSGPKRPQAAKGGPRRPQAASKRPGAPQSAPERPQTVPSGPQKPTRNNLFHGVPPLERAKKTAFPQRENDIFPYGFGRRIFSVFQRCQRQTQSTPRETHQKPADRPQRPRAAQNEPERPKRPPRTAECGPRWSTEATLKQAFHGEPLLEGPKTAFPQKETTYFRTGFGGRFFLKKNPTLPKKSPKHAQTTPPKASRAPTVAPSGPERPRAAPKRPPRVAQSGAERPRASQCAPERPRAASGPRP